MFNLPKIEERVLKFWKENQIFQKSIEQRKKAPHFVFYEGPPTANAKPGIHHVLSRVFKDIICRFKTMQGYLVERKAGWDTHGLPVELEIEKKLGFKTKKDIENYGIAKFNRECKKSVWQYKKDWEKLTERIGFWLDLKNPYITYEPEYIETVWFILKKIWEKGLLYQDFRVSPYCPRCQTVLSSHETAQGYKKIKEPAIYVKFKIENEKFENAFLLIWTTTPWTLPGNVAVAIGPKFQYLKVKTKEGERLILAKERFLALNLEGEIEEEFLGKDLIGLKYQPPFNFYQPDFQKERIWEVIGADFVSLEEGTGLVHIAPAFGEEDMELIKKENKNSQKKFPIILNVDEEGKFTEKVTKWKGIFVKEADKLIIEDLRERHLLFKEELYEHDYPFCWRCKTPLLYYAKKSWFIRMSALRDKLIENNQKINWIPEHIKEGRFGEWLKEIKDWALSRERYWGTPLPIWECQKCSFQLLIGSLEELKNQKFSQNRYLILRHGESVSNLKEIIISELPEKISSPLTPRGRRQIKRVLKKLKKEKIDLIFSSDLERAKETAEIIAKELKKEIIFDKRLREIKAGEFEGKSIQEYQNFWKSWEERFWKKPKGGENFLDVQKRLFSFFEDLERKYQGKTILIVSHQAPLFALRAFFENWSERDIVEKYKKEKLQPGELREIEFKRWPRDSNNQLDLHRPYIDLIEFFCPRCGGKMKRVPEVIDCWFDSGSMPFAQCHWLNSQPPLLFPADYIAEGIDQTRGWFYTLLAISTLLDFGPSFKNVIALGHVLDEKGEKMSKSKGNVVDPWLMIKKYGTETIRWYFFTINQPGDPKLFSEKDLNSKFKDFLLILWNCFQFYQTYKIEGKVSPKISISNSLDSWIISRLQTLIEKLTQALENYQITEGARLIEKFVIEDLSQWYIRRSRKRFQDPKNKKDLKKACENLAFIFLSLSKLLAPFLPFFSEFLYQEFGKKKSVHLEDWPIFQKEFKNETLENEMQKVRDICSLILAERAKAKIKVRQPLKMAKIKEKISNQELVEIIKEETNIKEIKIDPSLEIPLELDLEITPELKKEGVKREIVRIIQEIRKEKKLKPRDKIVVYIVANSQIKEIVKFFEKEILKETKSKKIEFKKEISQGKELKIEGETVTFKIKKIKVES